MKLKLTAEMTMEAMLDALKGANMPYQIETKTNPLFKWQYIEVRKTGMVGVWIRRFDKKNQVALLNCMPAIWARLMLGGLLFLPFVWGKQSKVRGEIAEVFKGRFGTSES